MKKRLENVLQMKGLFLVLTLAVLFATPSHVHAADGDLAWRINVPTSNGGAPYGGIATDQTGIYLAGYYITSFVSGDWSIEKRSLDGGVLIWQKKNFIDNGVPLDITVDSMGVYATGPVVYGEYQRIEKRSLVNGNIIWEKTIDYIAPSFVFFIDETFNGPGIAVNDSGVYIVADDDSLGSTLMVDPIWGPMNISNSQWRIEKRSLDTGDLIWTKTSNPSSGPDVVHKVAADNSGIYVVGEHFVSLGSFYSDTQWRIEKRSLGTGDLLWVKTVDPSIFRDRLHGVTVDGSGVYTAGTSNANWRIEKRSLNAGDIVWQKEIPPPNSYWGVAQDIAVNSSGVYIVGSDTYANAGNMNWRMEKRSLATGDLIWQKIIPEGISSAALGVAADVSSVYAIGWSTVPGSNWWPLEKRESIPNSSCGSASGTVTAVAPVPTPAIPPNNLCTSGTAPIVTDAGVSFDWTCDGPDNLDATVDDVACSAQKPPTLSLCTASGIPVAVASAIPYSRALLVGSSESFNAFYDATPNICTDSAPITDATWIDGLVAPIVSLAGASTSPQTVTASLVGNERVEVVKESDRIFIDYTVGMPCISSCTPARRAQECSGVTFPETDSCGIAETCAGTRYCDFNWKEVAPGQ